MANNHMPIEEYGLQKEVFRLRRAIAILKGSPEMQRVDRLVSEKKRANKLLSSSDALLEVCQEYPELVKACPEVRREMGDREMGRRNKLVKDLK